MNALKSSCSAEAAPSYPWAQACSKVRKCEQTSRKTSGPVASSPGLTASPEKRRYRATRKKTRRYRWRTRRTPDRHERRACSDTIEESSSVDEDDVRRKRLRSDRGSQNSYYTHLQSHTSHLSHFTTLSTHGLWSNVVCPAPPLRQLR